MPRQCRILQVRQPQQSSQSHHSGRPGGWTIPPSGKEMDGQRQRVDFPVNARTAVDIFFWFSWRVLSAFSLARETPIVLRNFLCFRYLFQLSPSPVLRADPCIVDKTGCLILAASSSFSLIAFVDLFNSVLCCFIVSSVVLPDT